MLMADMTVDDITTTSPRFWQFHCDPAMSLDCGASLLALIQYNLCVGTLANYIKVRPELAPLVEDLLRYDKQ